MTEERVAELLTGAGLSSNDTELVTNEEEPALKKQRVEEPTLTALEHPVQQLEEERTVRFLCFAT